MAALSRPSLRSSSRRVNLAGLDELPATDIQHNPSPATKPGKHTRDLSSADHHAQPLKKQRLHSDAFLRSRAFAQSRRGQDLLVFRGVTRNSVARTESLRQSDHLRPPFNGAKPADLKHDQTPKDDCIAVANAVPTGRLEKRNLRSHDGGSRSKSELALYFSNYDELVSTEAKDPGWFPFPSNWPRIRSPGGRFSDRTHSHPHCRRAFQVYYGLTTGDIDQTCLPYVPRKPPIPHSNRILAKSGLVSRWCADSKQATTNRLFID